METEAKKGKFKGTMKEVKDTSKTLYFKGYTATQIIEVVDVKLATLKSWIYGQHNKAGWKVDKELNQNQLLRDLTDDKKQMVYSMVNGVMFLLYDFVENAKKEAFVKGKSIDIRTAEKLTGILGNLHKIVEVEKERDSTDGAFIKPVTAKELQKRAIKADPFLEVKEQNKEAADSVVIHETIVEEIAKESKNEIKNESNTDSSSDSDDDNDEWFS